MDFAETDGCSWLVGCLTLFSRLTGVLNTHGQRCQHLVVDGQILHGLVVGDLIVGTLDHLVLVKLFDTLKTKRVATWQRDWFLVIVVVRLKADATLEYLIHIFLSNYYLSIKMLEKVINIAIQLITNFINE
jgi:hypothetical protein